MPNWRRGRSRGRSPGCRWWSRIDLVDVAGLPTTRGSPIYRDAVADHDDLMVQRMRAAGAVIVGKSNVPEFGAGSHTFNTVDQDIFTSPPRWIPARVTLEHYYSTFIVGQFYRNVLNSLFISAVAVRRVLHVSPAQRRRFRPAQATLEQHGGKRPIGGAPVGCCRFRFHAAPGAPGQAGRCEDGGAIVRRERIGLAAAPARRLAGEALQHAAHASMAGRIVGAGVNVAGADRGADGADGGRSGAIGNPLGKVGGDGERIGWQRLVAGECGPFRPPAPCAAVLRPRVAGATIAECRIDARPVGCAQFDRQGGGERSGYL